MAAKDFIIFILSSAGGSIVVGGSVNQFIRKTQV